MTMNEELNLTLLHIRLIDRYEASKSGKHSPDLYNDLRWLIGGAYAVPASNKTIDQRADEIFTTWAERKDAPPWAV